MEMMLKEHKKPTESSYEIGKDEVEHALHIIAMAEEYKQRPELMKKVSEAAKKRVKTISSIADLKAARDKVSEEEDKALPSKAKVEAEDQMEEDAADEEVETRVKGE